MQIQRLEPKLTPCFPRQDLTPGKSIPGAPASPLPGDQTRLGGYYVVRRTDSLWNISERTLGDPLRWREIARLNPDKFQDPDLIFPGTVLRMPARQSTTPTSPAKPVKPAPIPARPEQPATPPAPVNRPPAPVVRPLPVPVPRPAYPTVGEYVKDRVERTVERSVDGLEAAAGIAFPPLLVGQILAIKAAAKERAISRIWDLPMDPKGEWKREASRISDEEAARADAQIRALPAVRALDAATDAVGDGIAWTGRTLASGARAVGDGASAVGHAVVDGATWAGRQAVELPRSAARGTLSGLESIGEGISRFSRWARQAID
jgi:LysM repeat protein